MTTDDNGPVTVDELAALALGNYGHFTSMLVTDGRVRGLALHLQRLVDDCRVLFDADLDPHEVRQRVHDSGLPSVARVRVTVFAPDLERGEPGGPVVPTILVSHGPAATQPLPPLRLVSAAYQRDLAAVKHVGLFAATLHRRAAQRQGADDVLFVDARSTISEGSRWNIGFIDDADRVVWPAGDCLSGVTMRLLDDACRAAGHDTVRRAIDLAERHTMRGAFATNAVAGVRPIAQLDGTRYDVAHPALRRLTDLYAAVPADRL